jgi:hypothetical protein
VLLRGTAMAQAAGLVTIECPTKLDTRSCCRAHERVNCILKNAEAFRRAIEDLAVEGREKRNNIAGHPRQQLRPEQARARAAAIGGGSLRQWRTISAAAWGRPRGAGSPSLHGLARRGVIAASILEPSAAPDDVSNSRRRAAVVSPDLGDRRTAVILLENLRLFVVRDLSFCPRTCHGFSPTSSSSTGDDTDTIRCAVVQQRRWFLFYLRHTE